MKASAALILMEHFLAATVSSRREARYLPGRWKATYLCQRNGEQWAVWAEVLRAIFHCHLHECMYNMCRWKTPLPCNRKEEKRGIERQIPKFNTVVTVISRLRRISKRTTVIEPQLLYTHYVQDFCGDGCRS
jgi:hypothetical protein